LPPARDGAGTVPYFLLDEKFGFPGEQATSLTCRVNDTSRCCC